MNYMVAWMNVRIHLPITIFSLNFFLMTRHTPRLLTLGERIFSECICIQKRRQKRLFCIPLPDYNHIGTVGIAAFHLNIDNFIWCDGYTMTGRENRKRHVGIRQDDSPLAVLSEYICGSYPYGRGDCDDPCHRSWYFCAEEAQPWKWENASPPFEKEWRAAFMVSARQMYICL